MTPTHNIDPLKNYSSAIRAAKRLYEKLPVIVPASKTYKNC
ncbi:13063_t:CDS:2 [Acaulospora colombiana]|uniref:13063_t:CDS:1 n=1 Tax=Acaulospora colombiana TaxID=27376 RepID=A0ACA9JWF6_9GLOM|nr:13063_t:CDS:2 [Acaulospora colombiana]